MTPAASATRPPIGAWVRRAATAFTTPLLPTDYLRLVDPLRSSRAHLGRVERVVPETEDTVTLVIRPGRGPITYRAGQWMPVGVRIDGVWHTRCYSLTSPEGSPDGLLRITVRAVDGGRVSPRLVHHTQPGTVLRLGEAQGEFVLPDPPPGRLLFLTAGSGITPVMGMLRTLATRAWGPGDTPDVLHVHSARHAHEVIFAQELRGLARRLPGYRLRERHSGREGRFAPSDLDQMCADWPQRPTWACGPAGLLDDVQTHWIERRAAGRLHLERFQPLTFRPTDTRGGPDPGDANGGTVTFTRTGRDARAPDRTPLLEVGERAGVVMPSGCRMGICFSCVAPLRAGRVRDLRTGEIHSDQGEPIQTCVSGAAGPCAIDL
jgi:ferredoxin-NADP reductase